MKCGGSSDPLPLYVCYFFGIFMETVIVIDIKRMEQALQEERVQVPQGLTTEEKRRFIMSYANNDLTTIHQKV